MTFIPDLLFDGGFLLMKTNEDLKEIKEEFEELNKKLSELSEDELAQVSGGGANMSPMKSPQGKQP